MNDFITDLHTKDFERYRDVIVVDYDKKLNSLYDYIIENMEMVVKEDKGIQNHESDDVVSNHWIQINHWIQEGYNKKYHIFKVQVRSKNKKLYKVVAIEKAKKKIEGNI